MIARDGLANSRNDNVIPGRIVNKTQMANQPSAAGCSQANPGMTELAAKVAGPQVLDQPQALLGSPITPMTAPCRSSRAQAATRQKKIMARLIARSTGIRWTRLAHFRRAESKRIPTEYKRQLLNLLETVALFTMP